KICNQCKIWKIKKNKNKNEHKYFLRGKTSMRKHPRVDTTTTGEAIHYVKKDLHTQAITHDIRSSYQLLIYPRASESPSLLPIRDVPTPLESNFLSKTLTSLGRFLACLSGSS